MAPQTMVQLMYIHISYIETRNKTKPYYQTMMKYCNSQLSDFVITHRDWVLSNMFYEKSRLPKEMDVRYTEWRVIINDAELFTIYGVQFEKILLVLGEQYVYWTFYMNSNNSRKKIQGKGRIPLTYCPCCIHEQYRGIVNAVREYIFKYFKLKKSPSRNEITNQ